MSKLVFMWHEEPDRPVWSNHYATIELFPKNGGDVYELKTTAFNPNDKNNFLMGQRFMGAFKTLEQAKTAAKMLYDAESYIRETAVY